jgi:hypothetical protein
VPPEILLTKRLIDVRAPALLWAAVAIVLLHGVYVLLSGVHMAPDSYTYDLYSSRLLESGFSYRRVLAEADAKVDFPALLYVLFTTFVAILKLIFGNAWPIALVAANFGAHVLLGMLIVRLANLIAGPLAGWTALLLFLGCFDLLQWVNVVSSDTTFFSLTFWVFSLTANRLLGRARNWWPVAALAFAGVFYRPTGLVLLPDLAWGWFLSRRAIVPRQMLFMLAAAASLAVLGLACFAWLMQGPARWPFNILAGSFEVVAKGYAAGEVVSARPETYHAPPAAMLDYLLITADRFVHFFAIGAAPHSWSHWLVSALFFVPCYGLALWLIWALARGSDAMSLGGRKVIFTAAGAIVAYAIFHGMIQVDFDWRYRAPILAELMLMASAGLALAARKVSGA